MNKLLQRFSSIPPAREWVPILLITIVLTISFLDLIGWIFSITWLKNFDPRWTPMKVITALCLILSAIALFLIKKRTSDLFRINFARITGTFFLIVSTLTIIVFIDQLYSGRESVLANTSILNLFLAYDTRMALLSAVIFFILGIILILLSRNSHKSDEVVHILLFPAAILSYYVPVSYFMGVHELFGVDKIFVALNTGIALFLLCLTIALIRIDTWLMSILTGHNAGSIMVRKLLPGLIILPVLIGWLRIQGEQHGYYKSEVGVILVALIYTVCFLLLVWLSARSVNRIDEKRQKSVEAQLLLEHRFATTLASIGDAVIATDTEGKIDFMNPEAENLTGWTLAEVINKPVSEVFCIINEGTRKEVESPVEKVLETGMQLNLANHTILIRKDRTEVFIDDSAAPIKDKDGTILGVVLVFRDISERKKADQVLRESEQRLRFHFENSPLAVVEWDANYMVTQWSREAEHIFGWEKEETLGKPINDLHLIYEEDIPVVNKTMERLSGGRELMVVTSNRNCTKSGKVIDCIWYNSVLTDKDGNMNSVMSLVQDITERKKTEVALKESEEKYRGILETANEGIMIADISGNISFVNARMAEMLGYTIEELKGVKGVSLISQQDYQVATDKIEKRKIGVSDQYEINFMRKDGSKLWALASGTPLHDREGQHIGNFGMYMDITQSKLAEEALRESEEKFHSLANSMPQLAWIANADGYISWYNQKWYDFTGTTPEEMEGWGWQSVHDPKTLHEVMKKWKASLENEKEFEMIFPLLGKNGKFKNFLTRGLPLFNSEGKLLQWFGTNTDVTEMQEAEQALRESENRLKISQEMGHLGGWEIDLVHANLTWSDEIYRIFGLSPQEFDPTYEAFLEAVHPDDREAVNKAYSESVKDGKDGYEIDHRVIRKNTGEIRYVHEKCTHLRDESGKIIKSLGMVHDITQRKMYEIALEESEERVRIKLESILSPEGDIGELELGDILDTKDIQTMMDHFFRLVQIPMAIIDDKDKVLVAVGWQDICTKFHRVHPDTCRNCIESDLQLTAGIPKGEYKLYKCANGMWDMATPIFIGGQHKGNLFMGQFFFEDEQIDYDLFRSNAVRYSFNDKDYMTALENVPRINPEKLESAKGFFLKLANKISKLSYSNIKLARYIAESERISLQLVKNNERLDILSEAGGKLLGSKNPRELVEQLCSRVMKFLDCQAFFNFIVDEEAGRMHLNAYRGIPEKTAKSIEWLDFGVAICGCVALDGVRIIAENIQDTVDPRADLIRSFGIKAYCCHPILSHGKVLATLSFGTKSRISFSDDDIVMMKSVSDMVSIAMGRIKDEKAIKESEEKYRLLFNEMLEGFAFHEIILDENGKPCDYRFLSMNPAFEGHTGLKAENIMGKKASEVIPTFENYWINMYGEVALTGKTIEFENYNAHLNQYFKVSAFSPQKGYFAVIIENITERTLATKELYSTKTYLENLINYSNVPIIVWNPKQEIQLFNGAFEKLTGYRSSEVEGKKIDLLFPESSAAKTNEKIRQSVYENWESIEILILTKDKEERIVLWNSANIYDSDNKTLISTIAQGNDITERKKTEQSLNEAKEKLDLALDNGNIGTFERNLITNKLIWDRRMERMFGFEEGTFEGTNEAFERCLVEEDIPHTREAFRKAVEEKIPYETVYRIKLPNGNINHVNAKGLVIRDENGKALKLAGVSFDVTDMKKGAERILFDLNEELHRSNKELEQFAYVASHDLQEPLRMVSSFTQLLQKRYKDKLDDDAHQFIKYAVDGAVRMQGLINDLLSFSRIGTRGQKFSEVDFNQVIGRTISNLSISIQEKNALIVNDELPSVYGDMSQLVQLMQNLIGNAIKFCDTNPRIKISSAEENNHYVFSVKDNGIGIEKNYFEKIFLIFQRLVSKEEYGGTGIGLAICKRIIERHGGKIWVESEAGEGSTFYFTLNKPKNF